MEAVKKYWLWGIFISILSIFAMSHNANAIDFTINLDDYTLSRDSGLTRIDVDVNSTSLCTNTFECAVFNSTDFSHVNKFKTNGVIPVKANDIVVMTALIGSQKIDGSYTSVVPFIQRNFTTNNSNLIYLGYDIHSVNDRNFISSQGYGPGTDEYFTQLLSVYQQLDLVRYYFRVQVSGSYNIGFESPNYSSPGRSIYTFPAYSSSSAFIFSIPAIQVWSQLESKENKEVEQKTQEAVDESQTAGGDSSTSAQTGTTGLLNAITGAVSVISSAQPTNCKINGNMGNLDIGQLDLCANPAPAFVQTIGSLILILMCVPLAISLFNRFIAIFRSFQS